MQKRRPDHCAPRGLLQSGGYNQGKLKALEAERQILHGSQTLQAGRDIQPHGTVQNRAKADETGSPLCGQGA